MIDVGDLREGIYFKNFEKIRYSVDNIMNLNNIHLKGIGTNFSCFGGVRPTKEKFDILIDIKKELEKIFKSKIEIVSGGSSGTLSIFNKVEIPKEINQLRCGAAIALEIGLDDKPFEYLHQDTVEFVSKFVEIKSKKINGKWKKIGVCLINTPGLKTEYFIPKDKNIEIIDINNDYLILDITKSNKVYYLNNKIKFYLSYGGLLLMMGSPYTNKIYINKEL